MGKRDDLRELVNILVKALRHRIGSIVNPDELYAEKYAKDADVLLNQARMVLSRENWNDYDKRVIKVELEKKLFIELDEKKFLNEKKFEIMDGEIEQVLGEMGLLAG